MATQLLPFMHVLIFLLSFIKVSVASDAVNWTTIPKDSEHFVGSDAILRWEYSTHPSNKIRFIKFGIKVRANESVTDVVIIRKDVLTRVVTFNKKSDREVTAPFDGRVSVLKNETASFKIRKLTMSDAGTYFCYLEPEDRIDGMPGNDEVKIKVVDIIIDRENSTVFIESWKGHRITMKCVVRKAITNSTVRFYWHRSNGQVLPGREVYFKDRELSQKTVVTDTDAQFNPVRCTAKTETTTQTLDIIIKRLHKPTEPVNVTVQEIRSNNTDCHVHNKLIWEPPVDDGDTPITSYIVEYKHPVFNRILISETVNDYREHVICKLQASGYPREVHVDVRAINKVGRGFRSRVVPVSFFSSPSAPLNLTNSLVRKQQPPFDVWVSWSPPEEHGGSPVLQYQLEYKEEGSPWIDATALKTNNTYILISKNEKAYIYEVRVTAENKFGFGASSEVVTAAFAEKPDAPQDLVKGKVFYDQQNRPNIKVVWKPPNYDGGSAIRHYIVEQKTVKTEWSTAANATVEKTEYSLQVKKSETYTVRVTAMNKLGVGKPAVITVKFTDEDVKNLARSNKSRASMTSSCFLGMLLLLSALSNALA